MVLIFISLMISDVCGPSVYLLWRTTIFLTPLPIFKNQLIILLLSCRNSLYSLDLTHTYYIYDSYIWFANIFPMPFLSIVFFEGQKGLSLLCSHCLILLLLSVFLELNPRNHCQTHSTEASVMFSSKSFIVFGLNCRSVIHFELIIACGVR